MPQGWEVSRNIDGREWLKAGVASIHRSRTGPAFLGLGKLFLGCPQSGDRRKPLPQAHGEEQRSEQISAKFFKDGFIGGVADNQEFIEGGKVIGEANGRTKKTAYSCS